MLPQVGYFREPLADLAIDIVQIGELAQRPEALTCVPDGALHFAFGKGRQVHRMMAVHNNVFA